MSKKALAAKLTVVKPPRVSGTAMLTSVVKVPKRSEKLPPRFEAASVEKMMDVPTTVDVPSLSAWAAF